MNAVSKQKFAKGKEGDPPPFLQVLIPGDFKSKDSVNAHSKGFADAFFVCAHSKGLASVEVAESLTMSGSVAPAELLAGFAIPLTSAVIGRPFMNTGNSKYI
jgi:hypothetical protein